MHAKLVQRGQPARSSSAASLRQAHRRPQGVVRLSGASAADPADTWLSGLAAVFGIAAPHVLRLHVFPLGACGLQPAFQTNVPGAALLAVPGTNYGTSGIVCAIWRAMTCLKVSCLKSESPVSRGTGQRHGAARPGSSRASQRLLPTRRRCGPRPGRRKATCPNPDSTGRTNRPSSCRRRTDQG